MQNRPRNYSIPSLKQDDVLKAFVVEIKNQFQLLSTKQTNHPHVEGNGTRLRMYTVTQQRALLGIQGPLRDMAFHRHMEENRREKTIKSKILSTKSNIIQGRLQLEYSIKDKEMKKSARHDKRAHVDIVAMKLEIAAERGEISTVYRLAKQLCRYTQASESNVNDKEGNLDNRGNPS